MWGNGFQPTFRGKLNSALGITRLEYRFGAPPFLLIFFALWYTGLGSMLVSILTAYIGDAYAGRDALMNVAFVILFLFVPVGFHLIFNRGADRHFESILAFLKEHAGFKVDDDPRLG